MGGTQAAKHKLCIVGAGEKQKEAEPGAIQQAEEHKLNQGLEAEEQKPENDRITVEQNERQDLNQGMTTGMHDSTRHGVNWGPAYRTGIAVAKKGRKNHEPEKESD
jgi:hypothetical protein